MLERLIALPLLTKVCAGLVVALAASLSVNLSLYGQLSAKDAECKVKMLEAAVSARAAAEDEREREQEVIAEVAEAERAEATEKLNAAAQRAATAARRLENLVREHPPLPADAPAGDCFMPAEWVRAADAAVPSR
jgi:hypothetical protein